MDHRPHLGTTFRLLFVVALACAGCGDDAGSPMDAGPVDSAAHDSAAHDAELDAVTDSGTSDAASADASTPGGALVVSVPNGSGGLVCRTSFAALTRYAFPRDGELTGRGTAVVPGDLNADGVLDLIAAVADPDVGVGVLLGHSSGDGTFDSATTFSASSAPRAGANSVVVGRFDEDEHLDVAITNGNADSLSVLLGDGEGTVTLYEEHDLQAEPRALITEDLDRDSAPDLVAASTGPGNGIASVLMGDGAGMFVRTGVGAGRSASDVAAGTIDADQHFDLVTADYLGNARLLRGRGDGDFENSSVLDVGGVGTRHAELAHLNDDSALDVVLSLEFTAPESNAVMVLIGNGDATFAEAVRLDVDDAIRALHTADIDGDGALDIVVAHMFEPGISFLFGRGDGTFHPATRLDSTASYSSIGTADLNGDGRLDIITTVSDDVGILLSATCP